MSDMKRYSVTRRPGHPARPLFEGRGLMDCLDWIRDHHRPGDGPLAIWVDEPAMVADPEVSVCLPAWFVGAWRDRAAGIVDGWEERWLLVQSAPARHRDEARQDLLDAISAALAAAVASSLVDGADVGF